MPTKRKMWYVPETRPPYLRVFWPPKYDYKVKIYPSHLNFEISKVYIFEYFKINKSRTNFLLIFLQNIVALLVTLNISGSCLYNFFSPKYKRINYEIEIKNLI